MGPLPEPPGGALRRFVVEIVPTPDGRVVGTVDEGGNVVAFSGWMDLMRLLEPAPARPAPDPGPRP